MSIIEQRSSVRGNAVQTSDVAGTQRTFVTDDGVVLNVRTSGPADAEATVVLVHGWTQDNTCWDPIVAGLGKGVRIVRHDHRGHGASGPAPEGTRTLEHLADDLAAVIGAHAAEGKLVLAGHSMGGMTLMALAERHPELVSKRVAAVAFVATSSGEMNRITLGLRGTLGRSVPRIEPILRTLLEKRRNGSLPGNPRVLSPATRWLVFGRRARQADVIETTKQALRAHPPSIGGFLDAIFDHDRKVCLGALRETPTVVMAGDRDRLCPVPHARVIAESLEETDYVLFPGAGHMLTYERTAEVTAQIRALLASAITAR